MTKQKHPEIAFYPPQQAFLDAVVPIRGFVGGRGTGKSHVGTWDLCRRARPGRTYMIVAPTYPMLRDSSMKSFETIARFTGRLGPKVAGTQLLHSQPPNAKIACLGGGIAEVLLRSGDNPESLRGPNLSGVWMDEASLLSEDAFGIVLACLRQGGELGWMSLTFTPKGRRHWTYELFYDEEGGLRPDTFLQHARTSENPFIDAKYEALVRRQYTGQFAQQELEGLFLELGGLMFMPEWFEPTIKPYEVPAGAKRVRYWDKAATSGGGDYSAGVLMALDGGTYYVEDVVRGQWSPAMRNKVIIQTARSDKQKYRGSNVRVILEQEPGSGGKESAMLSVQQLAGFSVQIDKVSGAKHRVKDRMRLPGEAKVIRAMPWAAQAEYGNVHLVQGRFNKEWLSEVCTFPEAQHDDQVDATSGAFAHLAPTAPVDGHGRPAWGHSDRPIQTYHPFSRVSTGESGGKRRHLYG
jgi:predicted phage terminase large subunit-like protein